MVGGSLRVLQLLVHLRRVAMGILATKGYECALLVGSNIRSILYL
jgi:hypothetical protein